MCHQVCINLHKWIFKIMYFFTHWRSLHINECRFISLYLIITWKSFRDKLSFLCLQWMILLFPFSEIIIMPNYSFIIEILFTIKSVLKLQCEGPTWWHSKLSHHWSTSVPHGHWFETKLFYFWTSSLLAFLGRQQWMAWVLVAFTHTEDLAADFSLAPPAFAALWEVNKYMKNAWHWDWPVDGLNGSGGCGQNVPETWLYGFLCLRPTAQSSCISCTA